MEYEMNPYAVYVKRDEQGRIMNINSDAFLTDLTGWVKVDEGYTLRHCHAQGNYLPLPVYDERGICQYKIAPVGEISSISGEAFTTFLIGEGLYGVYARTQEEMDADYAELPLPEPTQADRTEAQALYTAMMTDTLLEV